MTIILLIFLNFKDLRESSNIFLNIENYCSTSTVDRSILKVNYVIKFYHFRKTIQRSILEIVDNILCPEFISETFLQFCVY